MTNAAGVSDVADGATDAAAAAAAACCAPAAREAIGADEAERLARLLKAVADPARLRLVSLVAAHDDMEACVCDLTEPLGLSQPTVSHHLKVLVDAGILTRDKRGTWAYYRLVPGALGTLADRVLGL
ncbi:MULTISPECIES: metalloregulator ArsR/SmtB family transcription factor [unclassified Cryobacterium]|uniref:ArsR/SmtB family transcription factor n=1 Tax=unclassified Cryobacterium TaxID=2649013 RepID=UPI001F5407F3|nr:MULTISPECIES: metalloregulator ArsR/SmtB family transcription factor [unclassified Cryobacterium]